MHMLTIVKVSMSKATVNCATLNFKHMHTFVKKQSITEVLLTFLALYVITQLLWMVIALKDISRNKIGVLWTILK